MEGGRERRIAQNEVFARKINESIDDERGDDEPGPRWFVCECAAVDCAELVDVGADNYRAVRSSPERFIVLPGHEQPDVEIIVETHGSYRVVEKNGQAGRVAEEHDDS